MALIMRTTLEKADSNLEEIIAQQGLTIGQQASMALGLTRINFEVVEENVIKILSGSVGPSEDDVVIGLNGMDTDDVGDIANHIGKQFKAGNTESAMYVFSYDEKGDCTLIRVREANDLRVGDTFEAGIRH